MSGVEQPGEFEKGKLFVGGISSDTTEADLRAHFEHFGRVRDAKVNFDQHTRNSRGFGFVTYETDEDVECALSCKEHVLCNKKIDPKKAQAKGTVRGDCKVFVGGIPPIEGDIISSNPEHARLMAEFKSAMEAGGGRVSEIDLKMDHDKKKHKGFAFVTFEAPDHARDACLAHKVMVMGKEVEIKKAQPKAYKSYIQHQNPQYYGQQWTQQSHQQRYSAGSGQYYQGEYGSSYPYGHQSSGYEQSMFQNPHPAASANQVSGYDFSYSTPHSESSSYGHGHNSYGQYHTPQHQHQQYSYQQQAAAAAPQAHAGYGGGQQQQAASYFGQPQQHHHHQQQMQHNPHHHSS